MWALSKKHFKININQENEQSQQMFYDRVSSTLSCQHNGMDTCP